MDSNKLIIQRYCGDCSLASLAMFLGCDYDDLLHLFENERKEGFPDGIWNHDIWAAANLYGVYFETKYGEQFNRSKPAMVCLQSLNYEGRGHMLYWDGSSIYDPANAPIKYDSLPETINYAFQAIENGE